MSPQVDMYKGQSLSPDYTLQIAINDTEAVITLNTLVGLVEPPGLLVLGADTEAPEVVRYTAPGVANQLVVERAVEGVANSWGTGAIVRNQLTALGYNNIIDNVTLNGEHTDTITGNPHEVTKNQIDANIVLNTNNATSTIGGVVRQKVVGTELFFTFDGSDLSEF
jgi:hypothetical protein